MMEEPFFAGQRKLFETMLEVGKKVEQEGVSVGIFREFGQQFSCLNCYRP